MEERDVLSKADLAEIESFYRKRTTPWRCRFGLHRWQDWVYITTLVFGAKSLQNGRTAPPIEIDIAMRLCQECMKIQTKSVQGPNPESIDMEDCDE